MPETAPTVPAASTRTEVVAGLTTFLATAYIVVVNPAILSDGTGMPFAGALTATVLLSGLLAPGGIGSTPDILQGPARGEGVDFYRHEVAEARREQRLVHARPGRGGGPALIVGRHSGSSGGLRRFVLGFVPAEFKSLHARGRELLHPKPGEAIRRAIRKRR